MSKIPEFRVWYDNKMWCLAKLDLWGDPDQAICDLAPYLPKYEELYDIYLSDVILMQSTGLKDKNGVEIFEGDIVRFKFKNETRIGFVEYVRSSFLINVGEIICDNKIRHSFSNLSSEEHEIIGDIYQNKDLLEG